MVKQYVTFHISASYTVEVDAEGVEEAKKKAWESFDGADFGDATDIDGELFAVDGANGERVWEAE